MHLRAGTPDGLEGAVCVGGTSCSLLLLVVCDLDL